MVLLWLKKYWPAAKAAFQNHPIGEWGMYAIPTVVTDYRAWLEVVDEPDVTREDITELSKKFLWHNFENGRFVSFAHPDFPEKAFRKFPEFLARQPEITAKAQELAGRLRSDHRQDFSLHVRTAYKQGIRPLQEPTTSVTLSTTLSQ